MKTNAHLIVSTLSIVILSVCSTYADTVEKRIQFARGSSSATIKDSLSANDRRYYDIRALTGQQITIRFGVPSANNGMKPITKQNDSCLSFEVIAPKAFGKLVLNYNSLSNEFIGKLPLSGDYYIAVHTPCNRITYQMEIRIQGQVDKAKIQANKNIFSRFRKYNSEEGINKLRKDNVEKPLGEICFPKEREFRFSDGSLLTCKKDEITIDALHEMGFPRNEKFFESLRSERLVRGVMGVSQIDIDNDGVDELRIWQTVGTANCTHSYFWKKDKAGTYKRIEHESYEVLQEEGRFCHMDRHCLLFIPDGGNILTIEINPISEVSDKETIGTIWKGSRNGLEEVCRITN